MFWSVQSEFTVCQLQEFENHSAQLNGAKMQLIQKLNSMYQILSKLANVTKAEEHAGELSRLAAELQQ